MKKNYIEVVVRTMVGAEDLLGVIEDAGSLGSYESAEGVRLYWSEEDWRPEVLDRIRLALRSFGEPIAEESITVGALPDQDWNRRWIESLQPVRIGRRILIRQSWNSAPVPQGGFEVVIDPRRAFGTGYHATTQLIVEWLEDSMGGGERVLDVGTGSGILAMVALRLGAGSALGIDNDPEAIECAMEYAAANGFGSELSLRVAALEDIAIEPFDLVVANIDRKTLVPYFPVLPDYLAAGGRLICSGLLAAEHDEVAEALAASGWQIRGRRDRDEWMAFDLRRRHLS